MQPKYNGIFPHGMWLGGTDLATEGTWLWESTQEPIIYTNWDTHSAIKEFISKQPDNLGKVNEDNKPIFSFLAGLQYPRDI